MHKDNKYGCQPHFDETYLLHLLQRLLIKIHDPRVSSARNSRDISLLYILCNLKVPMSPLFCWDRIVNVWIAYITKLCRGFSHYPRVKSAFFCLGAAFIKNFASIWAFDRERRFSGAACNRILYYRKLRLHEISC